MTLDEKIELFFYSPHEDRDKYIERYNILNPERIKKEKGGYRYSPLFLMIKDVHYCSGIGKELNACRKDIHPAEFAAVILLNTCLVSIVEKVFNGNLDRFSKDYLKVSNPDHILALKELRNALLHNFYALKARHRGTGVEFCFVLSIGYEDMIVEGTSKEANTRVFYINPRKFCSYFEDAMDRLRHDLLDIKSTLLRRAFEKSFDLDSWILIN